MVASPSLRRTSVSPSPGRFDDDEAPSHEKVCVAVRVRPMNQKEIASGANTVVSMHPRLGEVFVQGEPSGFPVDLPLWSIENTKALDGSDPVDQRALYTLVGAPLLEHALEGYNACILAYGQTGSGKTYSMLGQTDFNDMLIPGTEGLIPQICSGLFAAIAEKTGNIGDGEMFSWEVHASFVEIYCEKVSDLLSSVPTPVTIREESHRLKNEIHSRFRLVGATRKKVENTGDILALLKLGSSHRRTAATKMNDRSSRSHAIFVVEMTETLKIVLPDGKEATAPSKTVSIKLVDLAGSERVNESGVTGQNLKEANSINLSLFTLGHVIENLTDPRRRGIRPPYRDSALTKILKDSFGGNSKTTMIATVGPTETYKSQTVNTLTYATRARKITNIPIVEEDPQAVELRRKQQELDEVKKELELAKKGGVIAQELEIRLRDAEERMEQEQAEAEESRKQMAARELDLVLQLEANEEQQREFEERMSAIQEQTRIAAAERQARETELLMAQQHAEQEAKLKSAELEARKLEAKKREAELAERQKAAEEEARQREEEAKKREVELAERQKAAEEEARQREEEFASKRLGAEEEAKKREAELAERQKAAEEEARQREEEAKKREAELAERQKAAEEEARQREEEAKKREAELAERQKAAEEEARQREEEAKKREAELAERQKAAEEEARQREEEAKKREAAFLLRIEEAKEKEEAIAREARRREEEMMRKEEELNAKVGGMEKSIQRRSKELEKRVTSVLQAAREGEKKLLEKHAEADEKISKVNAQMERNQSLLKRKDLELQQKEKMQFEQKKHLDEVEKHRLAGKESSTTIVQDLLKRNEELQAREREWTRRYNLLLIEKQVVCPHCTFYNKMESENCELCLKSLR